MKMTMRFAFLVAAFACGSTLVACSSGSVKLTPPPTFTPSPTPTATPTPAPAAVHYTAIGASDAVGYGASVPCANPPTVAVPTCPGGTGYVPDLAKLLAKSGAVVTLNDLGISGAVIGPDILTTVNTYGALGTADQCMPRTAGVDAYPADFITAELPHLTGTETLVTVFAGGNDTNGIANAAGCMAAANPPATTEQIEAFVTSEIGAFGADMETLLGTVHAKAPNAKIYVANLPNFALIPVGQAQSLATQELLSTISVGIDLQVIDPLAATGTPVIDLLCNPQSYVPANFYTDGFHPNDAGYAAFAAAFYAQITATTPTAPSSSCTYIPTAIKVRNLPTGPLPDFSRGKT
jgi:lysophospholipase L1-like esterase